MNPNDNTLTIVNLFFECPLKGSNGKCVATTNQGGGDCDAVKSFFFLSAYFLIGFQEALFLVCQADILRV